jgi:hypothetical protein
MMVPLSYTYKMEDYCLSLAFAGQRCGFCIDVVAGHPVENFNPFGLALDPIFHPQAQ